MSTATAAPITGVRAGSLAEAAGIVAGDVIVSVGGRQLRDVVDLQFLQAEPEVEVVVRKRSGDEDRIVFEKDIDDDLGLEFDRATWDNVTLCNNNCFFCFLKGLPQGMRRTLYTKDDDYRLSFLHGNFVTLTNLTEADWARLSEQRLSPLNVSVHATELGLRRKLLGNPAAPDVIAQVRRLGDLGIQVHAQIVLTPGVNDGEHLERSLADLTTLHPTVLTVSIVPVGASPRLEDRALQRDGILLERPTPAFAAALVAQLRPYQRHCRATYGRTIVQASDEYYVLAGAGVPTARSYDGFPQYENGVGMVRRMLDEWGRLRRSLPHRPVRTRLRRATIATGTLAAPLLEPIAAELGKVMGVSLDVVPVPNRVFGERVNVSGLLCGQDFAASLEGRPRPDVFVLPRPSLDYFGTRFLDDMTIEDVERRLGTSVAFATSWRDVVRALKGEPERPGPNPTTNGVPWSG